MSSPIIVCAIAVFILTVLVRVFTFPGEVLLMARKIPSITFLLWTHILSLLMYASWLMYGVLLEDFTLIFAQGTGLLSSGIFAGQIIWRKRKQSESTENVSSARQR